MNKKVLYITIASLIVSLSIAAVGINAQSSIDLEANNLDPNQCPTQQRNNIDNLKFEFLSYIEDQVESAELNSNRIHNIFDRYRRFQEDLNRVSSVALVYKWSRQSDSINSNKYCMMYAQTTLVEVRSALLDTYSQVLERKKSYLLNERLDSILNQFDDVQDDLHEVRNNINEFNDLFPCYLDQCIGG